MSANRVANAMCLVVALARVALALPSQPSSGQSAEGPRTARLPHSPPSSAGPMLPIISAMADVAIALAYFSIPASMLYFLRASETHLPVESIVYLFIGFIVACGVTHLIASWLPWYPTYWIWAAAKVATAVISCYTAYVLARLLPKAVQIPRFIQAMEGELARKHLSERSLRYQNDALQLLRNIVLRIRRNLTRASILKSSSREIGKALLKRDLFSKPQTDPSDDGLAVPRTVPEPNENALDATSRLLGDFVEHGEAALVADDDNENGPFSKVYGGRCLIYVPHSFQESQLSLVSEYTSRGMAKMAGTELDTRSQAVAEALSSSRCLILLSPRDTDIIRKAFSPAGTEDGDQQEDHKMFFRQPERCVDDIKATLLIRFHLSNGEESTAAAAADGTPRSSRDFLSPHDSPGDTTSVSRNPISSGDKTGTSHTSEGMEGGADWGLIVLQIQDPGLDRDELLERVEFAASLLTDAAEQIGIALNQASSIELDRLRMENLRQQNDLLLAARREIEVAQDHRDFLTVVSHELRTPLYAITALSGILLEGFFAGADAEEDAERAEAHELVQVIKQSSDVLVQIVNNILDFSKYENSSLVLENRPFNVRDAVDLALEIVSAAQTKDGPHINAFVFDDPSTRMVVGDVTRFNQIVTNLTQNGAKFTAEGDVVLVVVTSIDPSGPDVVVVEGFVRDTGVGVAQEHSDKLFRQFAQLEESISRRFGGTGLGLNIVKRLCGLMNGDVWLANDGGKGLYELADMPDYGATFRFKIKLNRFVPSKWKQEEIADLPSLTEPARGSQIAVIDDHKINSDALFRQLVDLGIDPDHISVFRSLADYLESGKSAHGIVVDIKTVSNKEEIILLRRMLKNGLESRILVLCSPIMQKSCRKMLKLGKESDLTVIMRPPKHHGLAKYINELPTNAMSIETAREAVRKPSTSVVVVSEGLAPPDSFPSTPLRTATTDVSSNITKFVGSVLDDSYSSDSSLPTVTTPSGTPQIGSEVLTARAAGQQDYFSLPMKHEHQVTAASAVGAEAAGEEAPKPVKKPSAPDVFVETKTGQKVKLPSFKVLVVEDNLINQKVTGRLLSRLGQHAEFADDGFAAIEKVQEAKASGENYQVIFMDLQMPVKDGFQTTREIRELVGNDVWICALSGNAFAEDRIRAKESTMDHFLAKPARQNDIKDALIKYVQDMSVV